MSEEPTVNASHVKLVLDALAASGIDVPDFCRRCGTELALFADPNARIPRSIVEAIWLEASRRMDSPTLGLDLGLKIVPRARNVVAYLAISSENVGDALERITQYQGIIGGAMTRIEVTRFDDRTRVAVAIDLLNPSIEAAVHEFNVVLLVRFLEWMTGGRLVPSEVMFAHRKPADVEPYIEALHAPVRFDAGVTAVMIHNQDLDRPSLHSSAAMAATHQQVAERQLSDLSQPTTSGRLRALLRSHVEVAGIDLPEAAKRLEMSTRTLQRRLAAEGTTYQKVYDEMRREVVVEHLSERDTPIAEIAVLAGFSDVSAFYRAFRRWTGTTPLQYRKSHR